MAWIQLLFFSLLSFTPLSSLSRSVPGDIDMYDDSGDDENICNSICEGIGEELRNCSRKLIEKADYSLNIEKELFAVKEQLRMSKLLCINSSQASSVQIAALQNQLDSMLKRLEKKAAQGPSQTVSNVLLEYVNAQKLELYLLAETDSEKIRELQEQLKKSRAELEILLGKLNEIECQTANSSQNRISELLGLLANFEEKIVNTQAECNDLQDNYNNLQEEFVNTEAEYNKLKQNYKNLLDTVDEISGKPDSNLKLMLEILLLIQEINNLENRIQTSECNRDSLEDELREKEQQLDSKKKESDEPGMKKVLTIISKLEDLWRFQSKNVDLNRLDQIQDKKHEVLALISELDDLNLAKIVLKNLVLLSDPTHLKKLISDLKQQADRQIAELQEEVRKKAEELKRKSAELQEKDSDVATLTKEIRELREELRNLKKQLKDLEKTSVSQLTELQKKLDETKQELEKWMNTLQDKETEFAKNVMKITVLLEELRETKEEASRKNQDAAKKITNLEDKLKKEESETKRLQDALKKDTECTELEKSYSKLKADFEDTVLKLNDSLLNQLFTVNALKQEVQRLEDDIRSSEGNAKELTFKLRDEKAKLKEAINNIKKWRQESLRILDLLEDLRKVNRKQAEHIQEYLAKINRLEEELEDLLTQLSSSGKEKTTLSIQVIFLKEELAKLNEDLVRLKEEHQEKTAGLEKEIEEKNKEIVYLERSGCGTDQLKNQISSLQQELEVKQRELEQLKRKNAAQIQELQKQLTEKNRKLEETTKQLKELDSENAELITKLADLNTHLNKNTEGQREDARAAQKHVSELEKQLRRLERDLSELKDKNKECEEQLSQEQRKVSVLKKENAELKDQLTQKEKEISDLNNNRELEEQLKQKEISDLKDKNAEGEELKKDNEKLINEKNNLQEDVTKLKDRVKELEKQPVTVKPPTVDIQSLQFDRNTAHRRLQISNERSVRGVQYSINRPADPRRYDVVIGTLTKTGFTMGRPYWEVQVKDRSCFTVGVAAESAARKGDIRYRPSNGYWVIQKRNKQHFLLTEPPFLLHLTDKLNVIGILVDFFKKEVAFYNVQTRMLLGIFEGNNFKQKLYPFVATCGTEGPKDWPIELLETGFPTWLPN